MPKAPITNIIFGTMTLGYSGYGARVHDAATADAMLGAVLEFVVRSDRANARERGFLYESMT